jgi:hypothetical protein
MMNIVLKQGNQEILIPHNKVDGTSFVSIVTDMALRGLLELRIEGKQDPLSLKFIIIGPYGDYDKIRAIKFLRELTGMGLTETKAAVETEGYMFTVSREKIHLVMANPIYNTQRAYSNLDSENVLNVFNNFGYKVKEV